MEIIHEYVKLRSEFGRQCLFSDRPAELLIDVPPNQKLAMQFVLKETRDLGVQGCWEMSEHEVNTERFEYDNEGINHVEGGWPKDINHLEMEQTIRFRKKIEKDEIYMNSVQVLGTLVGQCVGQNNAVDIYQEYFEEEELLDETQEKPCVKIVNVYRDPHLVKRHVTCLSWQPKGGTKLAGAYCCLELQKANIDMSQESYIWDIGGYNRQSENHTVFEYCVCVAENPTQPDITLNSTTQLICLKYNPDDMHALISGGVNGQIVLWDSRNGHCPAAITPSEESHKDPVYKVLWLKSSSGTDAFSASTDGQILWWDVRQLNEPIDRLILDLSRKDNQDKALGAISLDHNVSMPDTFLVGTEQGAVVYCNKAAETPAERIVRTYDGHHGPVYAIQRNPFFSQNFLTVGDWGARIWSQDIKESSVMWTKHQTDYLTDGCWSPVRPSVFFTVKMDGVLDIWDILFKQNDPTLSLKVRDEALCSLNVHEGGCRLACGSQQGIATLIDIKSGLCTPQHNEQELLGEMLERETKREKVLRAQRGGDEGGNSEDTQKELILRPEYDFHNVVESEQRRRQWETRTQHYP
ncbi:dynein axonemal intermediate chain 2-like isoform X1 [Corythoichthys intestinalis]|uniref:dynein axonemal intermediate chain 2-like isoform X1 n=1 Tax=Corythoichthys intestinalis TaxID=161448 RepID=UPI0025A68B58|nr:dynein axonemal intermediate chain 2-like isoform X1 [Corythoichthys intestinalis]